MWKMLSWVIFRMTKNSINIFYFFNTLKMKLKFLLAALFLCAVTAFTPRAGYESDVAGLLDNMYAGIDRTKTMQYTFFQKERMINGWNNAETFTKLNVAPLKVYLKTKTPEGGHIEVLYNDGERGGKALIKPNGFPYVNVKLHPTSKQMMGTQHHTILSIGFKKVKKIIQDAYKRAAAQNGVNQVFKVTGSTTYDGKDCYILQITDPTFAFTNYTVKAGQSLYDIARELNIAEYMIMERNKGIDDYFDIKTGQVIKIPTSYAAKTTLYIDKKTFLPIFQKMEDDKGLFEQYEMKGMKVNPMFSVAEFTEDWTDYGF
ncbi:DUF1571 domain-containing protein [Sphingobacteriales bacterium UPWRP_1]|nr:hypothetical protein BVG80_12835 [Sphingobacteriales bacterium TSM_CSM]PSJ74431.1 DUF1571 domain-containing protein [Sphingobacteriales bacterium UPWRP_1]